MKKSALSVAMSEDSDQPVHPPSMAIGFCLFLSFDSLEAVVGTCDQRSPDCEDVQADLSLCWLLHTETSSL